LLRKVIIFSLAPAIVGAIKASYDFDGSIDIRNLINRNLSSITNKKYTEIPYTPQNGVPLVLRYIREEYIILFKWIVSSQLNSFGAIMSPVVKNLVFPAWLATFTEAVIWKSVLYPLAGKFNLTKGIESFDYTEMIDGWFNNEIKKNHQELEENNPEQEVIQAGGTSVSLSTYKYWIMTEAEGKVKYLTNFERNKTNEVKVNLTDTESGETKDHTLTTLFASNNNLLLKLPKKYKINKMTVVDNTGKKYEIVAK
jgi:hypothetical protein